jgi:signal peptidase I
MAKKKSPPTNPTVNAPRVTVTGPQAAAPVATPRRGLAHAARESIEAMAIALVLALLFRAFVAEAFVIPTGSMALTLMGQHKDLLCPNCGYRYQVGASQETESPLQPSRLPPEAREVVSVMCPLCRVSTTVDPRTATGREYPTYGGDRILATRFNYDFGEPRRWDVFIFKYPGLAQENYIKRLIGLPNEQVSIWHGDVYIKPEGGDAFQIERRGPAKVREMAQIVYDNDYVVPSMTEKRWPPRWENAPRGAEGAQGPWTAGDDGRKFQIESAGGPTRWLRYRHYVPTLNDWARLKQGSLPADFHPAAQLITDFCAYNTGIYRLREAGREPALIGQHWVGDLMIESQLDVNSADGQVHFDLVKGGKHFGCELDCANGTARLSIEGQDDFHPTASTAVRGKGSHRVIFGNVDRQLMLWIDGTPVVFEGPTTYDPLDDEIPQATSADPLDLAPAGIGASSASLAVSHLRLWRDLYYIAAQQGQVSISDYGRSGMLAGSDYESLVKFFSTPSMWRPAGRPSPFEERQEAIFSLAADQFFPLGDNSPASKDARLWEVEPYVDRDLLVGKALLIFWPHSFDVLPGTSVPFPFFPNFARMGFIR